MKRIAKTKKDTMEIAKMFLSKILLEGRPRGARVVGLSGNLGAGKTAFVKAVAKHLSIKEVVNSPTFVIIKRYPIKKKGAHKFLFHLDAYRRCTPAGWRCNAKFVLHVEKDTVWRRFNEDKFWKAHDCILTHGNGQPPRGPMGPTRLELDKPVIVLNDAELGHGMNRGERRETPRLFVECEKLVYVHV